MDLLHGFSGRSVVTVVEDFQTLMRVYLEPRLCKIGLFPACQTQTRTKRGKGVKEKIIMSTFWGGICSNGFHIK